MDMLSIIERKRKLLSGNKTVNGIIGKDVCPIR